MTYPVLYGRVLAQLRQDLDLSQAEAARTMGLSTSTVAKIEVGAIVVAVHHLYAYADMLNHYSAQRLGPRAHRRSAADLMLLVERVSQELGKFEYQLLWALPEGDNEVDYRTLDPLIRSFLGGVK